MEDMLDMTVSETAPQVEETESITAGGAPVGDETVLTPDGEDTTPPPVGEDTPSEGSGDIVYRFNHETQTLSAADAPDFIQKLLKSQYDYEHKVAPHLDRLRSLAGDTAGDLGAVVERLEQVWDEAEYRRFLEAGGGNEEIAQGLLQAARARRVAQTPTTAALAAQQAAAARDTLTVRMGEQLQQLQQEFPDVRELSDLPRSVIDEASEQQISLLDGYLRYLYRNSRRAAAQRLAEEKAASAAVGSLRGAVDEVDRRDDQAAAFSSAFHKRFM